MSRMKPSSYCCAPLALGSLRASAVIAACAAILAGCAVYHARPLPKAPNLASVPSLSVPVARLRVSWLKPQTFHPAMGLSETNAITLAVADNPELKAARLAAGVARAQLLVAGLLPDPQIGGGLSKSSLLTGYNVSVAEDIAALVTRGAAERAAGDHLRQVHLNILWQEWQVAERARELFIESRAATRLRPVLDARRKLQSRLYHADMRMLRDGDSTRDAVTADFDAWKSAETAWTAFELRENRTRHALDALLGLAPDVRLRLRGNSRPDQVSRTQYRAALANLSYRRPDLLALRAGYRSAEARLRAAILAQFPLLRAGVTKSRSAGDGIPSIGFNVDLTLPLFNRNQGGIALARASRAELFRSYEARLDAATGEADTIWGALRIMHRQLQILDAHRAALMRTAGVARKSLARGSESLKDYVPLEVSALTTQAEAIQLRASLQKAQAVLATLLALPPDDGRRDMDTYRQTLPDTNPPIPPGYHTSRQRRS